MEQNSQKNLFQEHLECSHSISTVNVCNNDGRE